MSQKLTRRSLYLNRYVVPVVSLVMLVLCWASFRPPVAYTIAHTNWGTGVHAVTITQPGPALAKLGVRAGDAILTDRMPQWQRLLNCEPTWLGRPVPTIVQKADGTVISAVIPADLPLHVGSDVLTYFIAFFGLTLGAFLGYKRPSVMMLMLVLGIGWQIFSGLGFENYTGLIRNDVLRTIALDVCWIFADVFPPLFIAAFAVRFPGETPSPEKRRAIHLIDAIVLLGFVIEAIHVSFFNFIGNRGPYVAWYSIFEGITIILACTLSLRTSPERERARIGVVLAAIVVNGLGYAAVLTGYDLINSGALWVFDPVVLVIPLAVTYAVLRHKLFDIAFVLNRTLVYAITSAAALVLLAALEFVAERYLTTLTHAQSLAVELGIAILVVFSARGLHKRVDIAVDRLFFRARHEQEAALRTFAVNAQFYTSPDPLVRDVVGALERYGRVRGAGVYLSRNGTLENAASSFKQSPGEIDENDAAYVAIRAHHREIDTHDFTTEFPGSLVYPMLLGGRIAGAIVAGERESGEEMPPDIDDAIKRVTESVTIALASMETERVRQENQSLHQRLIALS